MVSTFPQFLQSLAGTVGKYSAENDRRMDREMFSKMMEVNPGFAMQYQSELAGLENREVQNQERQRQLMEQERVRAALADLGRTPDINPQAALARLSEVTGDPSYLGGFYKSQVGMGASSAGERAIAEVMRENPNMSYTEALEYVKSARLRGELGVSDDVADAKGKEAYEKKIKELEARLNLESDVVAANAAAEMAARGDIGDREKLQMERDNAKNAAINALQIEKDGLKNINVVMDRLQNNANLWTTGFMGTIGSIFPGTPQADFAADLETVFADSALNKLIELKNSSETGASGLGQVTEREISLLQASRAALMQSQSPEQFRENLKRYQEQRNITVKRVEDQYNRSFGEGGGVNSGNTRKRYNPATGRIE